MSITTVTLNLAGNNPRGKRTGAKRAKAYAAYRLKYPIDVLCVQETTVASRIRHGLDKHLKPAYRRVAGGKGRYIYAHHRLKTIAGGLITTPKKTWYKRDAKQAAWIVHEVNGIRGIDVSFHLEHEAKAGPHRLAQMRSIVKQVEAIAKKYQVKHHNICFAGDANSTDEVPELMALLGYPTVALGDKLETTATFYGWDGKASRRLDYIFSPTGHIQGITVNTTTSDHASIRARRTLTKDFAMNPDTLTALKDLGFYRGPIGAPHPGKAREAVRGFQRAWALGPPLAIDGIDGPATRAALLATVKAGGRISPHFKAREFACKCNGKHKDCRGIILDRRDLDALEQLRHAAYPKGLTIISAYRCPAHNKSVGGTIGSRHLTGQAFDIPPKVTASNDAIPARFKGRGTRKNKVVHLDSRPNRADWTY